MTTEERLDALERELGRPRRANRVLLVAMGAAVVVGLTGLTVTGQEKRATTLGVLDVNGKPRAALGLTLGGVPGLELLNAGGDVVWSTPKRRMP